MLQLRLIVSVIGAALEAFALAVSVPWLAACLLWQPDSIQALACCMVVGLLSGRLARLAGGVADFAALNRIEAMMVVSLCWAAIALVGAVPYWFFGLSPVDGLFESMSGFTGTGATVLADFSRLNSSMFFYRSYTQWLGGMGIIMLFVAVLPRFAGSGRQLFVAEAPSVDAEHLAPRIKNAARQFWGWYSFLTLVMCVCLYLTGIPWLDAMTSAFATLSTGGFSQHQHNFMGYQNKSAEWVGIVFMFLAGTNLTLQIRALKGRWRELFADAELRWYSLLVLLGTVILLLLVQAEVGVSLVDRVRVTLWQSVSLLSTTGSATVDYTQWPSGARAVLLLLMLVGACSGSAGGGPKVIRILLVFRYLGKVLSKIIHANLVISLKSGRRLLKQAEIQQIFTFVIIYFLFFLLGGTVATMLENDLLLGFSGALACLGNTGPGFGQLGPMGGYAELHWLTRLLFVFLMWAGRLEIMAVAVFLRLETWRDLRWQKN